MGPNRRQSTPATKNFWLRADASSVIDLVCEGSDSSSGKMDKEVKLEGMKGRERVNFRSIPDCQVQRVIPFS